MGIPSFTDRLLGDKRSKMILQPVWTMSAIFGTRPIIRQGWDLPDSAFVDFGLDGLRNDVGLEQGRAVILGFNPTVLVSFITDPNAR